MESQANAQSQLHVCIARMHLAPLYVRWIVSTRLSKGLCCTPKTCVLDVVIVSMRVHLVRLNTHRPVTMAHGVKWTNAHFVQADPKRTCLSPSFKNMGATVSQRANCRCVRKCARPRHSSQGVGTQSQTSSGSVSSPVDLDRVRGDGVQLTPSRASTSA